MSTQNPAASSLTCLPINLTVEDLERAITGGFASVNARLTPGLLRSAENLTFLDSEGNEIEVASIKFTVDPTFRAVRKPKAAKVETAAMPAAETEPKTAA